MTYEEIKGNLMKRIQKHFELTVTGDIYKGLLIFN